MPYSIIMPLQQGVSAHRAGRRIGAMAADLNNDPCAGKRERPPPRNALLQPTQRGRCQASTCFSKGAYLHGLGREVS